MCTRQDHHVRVPRRLAPERDRAATPRLEGDAGAASCTLDVMTSRRLRELRPHLLGGGGRLTLCLATLAALFAMHGPSMNHMLDMPGHSPGAPIAVAGMPSVVTGDGATLVASGKLPSVDRVSATMSSTGAAAHLMGHAGCVATLRSIAAISSPFVGVATPPDLRPSAVGGSGSAIAQRGPPEPSLDRLCISRT